MSVEALKIEAINRVIERLTRAVHDHDHVCGQPGCVASVEAAKLATELRTIVEAKPAHGETDEERAMFELALWVQRYLSSNVPPELLVGAMLCETVCLHHDNGRTKDEFLRVCRRGWDSVTAAETAATTIARTIGRPKSSPSTSPTQCACGEPGCEASPGSLG